MNNLSLSSVWLPPATIKKRRVRALELFRTLSDARSLFRIACKSCTGKIELGIFDAGYLGHALREEPACIAESFFQPLNLRSQSGLMSGILRNSGGSFLVTFCEIGAENLTLATVFLGAMVGMLVMGRAVLEQGLKQEGCNSMRQ